MDHKEATGMNTLTLPKNNEVHIKDNESLGSFINFYLTHFEEVSITSNDKYKYIIKGIKPTSDFGK